MLDNKLLSWGGDVYRAHCTPTSAGAAHSWLCLLPPDPTETDFVAQLSDLSHNSFAIP